MNHKIVIVGVGGQGTLLASKILGQLAVSENLAVKVSEVHGMAQRGGSVITHVIFGSEVYAPLVSEGEADFLLAFESLEAARALPFLSKDGTIIVSTQRILPMPVITGAEKYPADPLGGIRERVSACEIPADKLAEEAGSIKAVNVVLLGAMAKRLPFEKDKWLSALEKCVPAKYLELNRRAFTLGYENS
ncbi:MAG: indolepyruvate oxidoreductase subunit beta [Eubacteriales bacterium]|nr:indolepyruvate oxidoreductase subunit beta [Eubacteriales bacterium]MDD3881373.1 indolepyruvate oxidoreductase subunit beta [Eubacteriales bacterium]MDD4513060.1 indolepyruvate oxidoreductase subunit beta [Eubacteriales bacterium]